MEFQPLSGDKIKPYEPIDGLYDAFDQYKKSAILDGSVTPWDLLRTAYILAGRSPIGCERNTNLLLLIKEEIEALRQA